MKLFIVERIVICKKIIFFYTMVTTVWRMSNKILRKIRAAISNYLQSGIDQFIRTRVSWKECDIIFFL